MKSNARVIFIFLLLLTGVSQASPSESIQFYLYVPGSTGDVTESGFEGWFRLTSYRCRLPGVPSAKVLHSNPPKSNRGMITKAELKSRICSFSKPTEKGDATLQKAYQAKTRFKQWQITLCTAEGKSFMNYLFKGVLISGISTRDGKLYVTFAFERVIWNYSKIYHK